MRVTDSPYESLIQQIIQVEREPQFRLQAERAEAKRFKGVLSDFDSKLSALHKTLKSFADVVTNPFDARGAQTGDHGAFSVTADDNTVTGAHSLRVDRLAQTDTRLSQQVQSAGTSLDAFFGANGAQTFQIEVAHPTDADPENRVAIDVTVDPATDFAAGADDETILKAISSKVNQAMADAADAGTITREERASMSVVNESSGTARLSLRSGGSGYSNRLSFTDSGGGLLSQLQLNSNTVLGDGDTTGGQVYDVGTSETTSMLTSKFNLDGMTIYRNSNSVDDVLAGLTINLEKADGATHDFSVGADSEGIKEDVQEFIDNYNDVLDYISNKSKVDGESGSRGDFAGEYTFTSLRFNMRSEAISAVASQPDGAPKFLSDLGIEVNKDGTLEIDDEEKLIAAVEKDAEAVQNFFANETDGFAVRLERRVDAFVGFDGYIDSRKDSIDRNVRRLDQKINDWDARLEKRTEMLRDQYAQVQRVTQSLQSQGQWFNSFGGGFF